MKLKKVTQRIDERHCSHIFTPLLNPQPRVNILIVLPYVATKLPVMSRETMCQEKVCPLSELLMMDVADTTIVTAGKALFSTVECLGFGYTGELSGAADILNGKGALEYRSHQRHSQ